MAAIPDQSRNWSHAAAQAKAQARMMEEQRRAQAEYEACQRGAATTVSGIKAEAERGVVIDGKAVRKGKTSTALDVTPRSR